MTLTGCCNYTKVCPKYPLMPQKVKDALPISDPVFLNYKLALIELRCQLEICRGEESKECKKLRTKNN